MTTHMHREIASLKDRLLELSSEVEKSISSSCRALEKFDDNLACQIITNDSRINDIEVNIEEDCLKILALYKLKEESTARVNGSDYIAGELIKVRDRFEEIDGKRLPVTERQYFIANRDLYNISFRYVDERDIVSTEVPENIMALEKLNDSRALVFPEKLVLEDGSELTKDDPSFLDKYADLVENAEDVRDEILDIEKSKIAPVIKENRQFLWVTYFTF